MIPEGFCQCGCGEKTPIATRSRTAKGWVKGQPHRYLTGHNLRSREPLPEPPNPSGRCQCGCGELTDVAPETHRGEGRVKGEFLRYVNGHNRRLSPNEYVIDEATGCWVWQRSISNTGYGQIRVDDRLLLAHRVYYEQAKGPIPEGLELHHLCVNRPCVNPDHLEPVTRAEHVRRHQEQGDVWPSREPVQGHGFPRTGTTTWHHSTAGTGGFPRGPYDRENAA